MKSMLEKEKTVLEVISDFYIFIIIVLFPLFVDKTGFFHILECKWYSYVAISCTYLLINILVILYFLLFKKTNILKTIKFTIIQWLCILFLIVNIISCFISPFFSKYDLFMGVGRGEGLIAMSLYTLSFLVVSLFAKFKKRYITYFSVTSILISFIAVLQYIGFNPLNMFQGNIGTHNVSFMSTIGNVDFLSAIYCILLTVSFCAFVFLDDNKRWEKLLHIMSVFLGFFILGIIDVRSGKVAFLSTLMIIFPFIILNNKRLSKFLILISTFFMSYCINIIINPEYHYDLQKLGLYFQFNYIVILFLIVCSVILFLAYKLSKIKFDFTNNRKIIKYYYLLVMAGFVLIILVLYFVNFENGILYEIHELLHGNFDDDFGTYRVFLWKRTLKLIPEYPILGSGPDSFAIRFMSKYTYDIMAIGPLTINDTAANVYLTMAVNLGIIGLLNYLIFMFFQIKIGINKMNNYSKILLIALVCYFVQDFFNLSVVIVTPILWILMALHYISLKNKINKNN